MAAIVFDLNADGVFDLDDRVLVEALRAGSERAYEELLSRFEQSVYALAVRLLNDQGEAYDVVQEVFLKVFRNIENFRCQSSLKTWIYRITVNEAHNARRWFCRHRGREVELDTELDEARTWKNTIADGGRSPFDVVLNREQAGMIEAALGRINPVFREAVVLRDVLDLSYEEVAEILQVSLGTVKSRILRGREALREELAGDLQARPTMHLVPNPAE